jgi:hypothetical protein
MFFEFDATLKMPKIKKLNCYGFQRKSKYWQFYKDYYGWDDKKVRNYPKTK